MIVVQNKKNRLGYIRRRDVEPELQEDGSLFVYWSEGALTLTSYEILNDPDLCSILIGYYGDSAGQFWRHYKNGSRINWKDLEDSDRARILDQSRPKWAKPPGKLKKDRLPPRYHERIEFDSAGAIVGYKYLIWDRRRNLFRSLSKPEGWTLPLCYWIDNSLEADKIPNEENTNGIYAAKTPDSPILERYGKIKRMRLVKLLLSGVVIERELGFRAEHADILEVLDQPEALYEYRK